MPRKSTKTKQIGAGILSNIKDFLKKSKLLSKTADTITKGLAEGSTARSIVGKVGAFAKEQGYGKRKRRTRKM